MATTAFTNFWHRTKWGIILSWNNWAVWNRKWKWMWYTNL